jgi:S-DNA-T family DNA segregation ATPase FtsK/SpoIIIE
MTPTPPPGSLAKVQQMDADLAEIGHRIGLWLSHPHVLTVASFRGHPAPGLALTLILLALCGVAPGLPAGVWMFKRRHHLRSSIRGLLSLTVWRERWKWHRSFKDLEINGRPAPKVLTGWPTRSGVTLVTRYDGGMNLELLQKQRPDFRAQMRCRDIEFERMRHNAGRGYARIIRRDPLASVTPWPALTAERTNFLAPFPVSADMDGKLVYMDLREKNLLVGGIPGSGKSWFLHVLIATAALDPRIRIWIFDGKGGAELGVWEPICEAFVTDLEADTMAMKVLKRLEDHVNKIYAGHRSIQDRKVDWSKVKVSDLFVIDEPTRFLKVAGFSATLNELLRRIRAAGGMIVFATQRPSAKYMDTDFRELFAYRAAMLSDDAGTTMILGEGFKEYDSSEFSGENPGEMWLLHEGRKPVHCRGLAITDRDLASLAARAQSLRANSPQTTVQVAGQVMPDTPIGSRSSQLPNLSLVPLSPQPVPLSVQRRAVLQAIADLGPGVEGAVVRAHLGMAPDRFSVHANALLTAGYATRAAKPLRSPQFGHGRPAWTWTSTDHGNAALSRTDASPTKEAGAQ